uniref:Uncharacterized protein LOC111102044 n=1 Tax=Crassostrea virginica TaxID=6565 RepID=A0A8B8AUN7_CRAVI|nr:uncharacterized protein LOC111102044 [Crassostrea virginica]XP_022294393.1 uncharacterized protein LOC111104630 [Crassostrea virginica]
MWSYKSCQYYVCYLVMILVLVSSTHSHPSNPRTKGHNIDKHVLQRYLQMRTLANHKVQTFKNINDFRQTLDKLEHIYSHKDKYSILKRLARDKRDAVGFAGTDILDRLLSRLLQSGGSDQAATFRPSFPRGRLSVNTNFDTLRGQMQSSG